MIASRLSEDRQNTVLLLEAGQDDLSPMGDQAYIPAMGIFNLKSEIDWEYYTEPQEKACLGMKERVRAVIDHSS